LRCGAAKGAGIYDYGDCYAGAGIGANAAIFTLACRAAKNLPVADPKMLVRGRDDDAA
jgi:hypothetical protein